MVVQETAYGESVTIVVQESLLELEKSPRTSTVALQSSQMLPEWFANRTTRGARWPLLHRSIYVSPASDFRKPILRTLADGAGSMRRRIASKTDLK